MKKTRTKVSHEIKEQILSESLQAGCDIELLAKRYKLSSTTIRKWRIFYNKQSETEVGADVAACKFIEVKQLPIKRRGSVASINQILQLALKLRFWTLCRHQHFKILKSRKFIIRSDYLSFLNYANIFNTSYSNFCRVKALEAKHGLSSFFYKSMVLFGDIV